MNTDTIIREYSLGGGVTATVRDCTRHYFGGYYHVRIQVSADVPVTAGAFEVPADFDDAVSRLGQSVVFSRILEKMAVPEAEIAAVRVQLLSAFDANVLPYLQRNDFAPGFVRSEYGKKIKSLPQFHGRYT